MVVEVLGLPNGGRYDAVEAWLSYFHMTVAGERNSMTEMINARRVMVDSQLRPQGVSDPAVLTAFAAVPREEFVPEKARAFAYFDRSIALRDGRWMMSPAALARLIEALVVKAGERALVVGSTGYAAAILANLGVDVTEAGLDADAAPKGPFDMILVEGAVEEISEGLASRLAAGGRIAAAIADRGVTRLAVGSGRGMRSFADADVPLLAGFARPAVFTF